MSRTGTRAALALAVAAMLLLGAEPAAAQQGGKDKAPSKGQTTTTRSSTSKEKLSDAEVDFVDSEYAIWNTRSVNDPIFFAGQSVNSVMIERSAETSKRVSRKLDFVIKTTVQDVDVSGASSQPTVLRIEGREVELRP